MKKITILILMVFGYFSNAQAIDGVNFGVSLTAGVFEADSGKEEFKGAHVGGASPGDISKSSVDTPEAMVGFASVFLEKEITDMFALGIDYVPHSMDTDTAENIQADKGAASKTNSVKVSFEDLLTVYGTAQLGDAGLYAKVGYVQVDVNTEETLATGGAYGNAELDGYTIGLGYARDIENDMFVRMEATYMDFDGATLTNTVDSTKSVTADGISGYGARLSIGRAF